MLHGGVSICHTENCKYVFSALHVGLLFTMVFTLSHAIILYVKESLELVEWRRDEGRCQSFQPTGAWLLPGCDTLDGSEEDNDSSMLACTGTASLAT